MSLTFLLCLSLSLNFVPCALAGPRSAKRVQLSSDLSSIIPVCAQKCVQDFISTSFPSSTCPNQQDLECLCTSRSTTGFTLGEGAIRCLATDCTNEQTSKFVAEYEICLSIPDAQPMTHGTLTASMADPSTIELDSHAFSTFSAPTTSIPATSVTTTSATQSPTTTLSSTINTSNSFTGILTATGTPPIPSFNPTLQPVGPTTTPTSSASSTSQPILTNAQIAGVAVAGAFTAAIAFTLLFFLFCRRKQGRRRNSGSSFGEDQVAGAEPNRSTPPQRHSPAISSVTSGSMPVKAQRLLLGTTVPGERRWSAWRKNVRPEDIGVAVSPDMNHQTNYEASPVSTIASYQTTSRLLPDKPMYKTVPAPARPAPVQKNGRAPASFAEGPGLRVVNMTPPLNPNQRNWQHSDPSYPVMQAGRPRKIPLDDPFLGISNNPRAEMYALGRGVPWRPQLPRIDTANTQPSTSGISWNTSPAVSRPPPTFVLTAPSVQSRKRDSTYQQHPVHSSQRPNVYSERHASQSSTIGESTPTFSKYAPLKFKNKRPTTFLTTGSDTSFEDEADDADTSTQGPSLSPVVESPKGRRTPPVPVRFPYPMVPGKLASPIKLRNVPATSPTKALPARPQRPPAAESSNVGPTSFSHNNAYPPSVRSIRYELPAESEITPAPLRPIKRINQQDRSNEDMRSAKWQILCSPGLQGIEPIGPWGEQ